MPVIASNALTGGGACAAIRAAAMACLFRSIKVHDTAPADSVTAQNRIATDVHRGNFLLMLSLAIGISSLDLFDWR
jgi:hypothetical protein